MRLFRLFPALALSLPALAQAGISGGLQLTQAGSTGGYTALGAQLILAPHPFNVIRVRFDQSVASQSPSNNAKNFSNLSIATTAVDYVHFRNGWNKPGFFIGGGLCKSDWSYESVDRYYGGKTSTRESGGGAQFIIGGQFNAHVSLEGRIQVLNFMGEYPLPFLAAALSFHF